MNDYAVAKAKPGLQGFSLRLPAASLPHHTRPAVAVDRKRQSRAASCDSRLAYLITRPALFSRNLNTAQCCDLRLKSKMTAPAITAINGSPTSHPPAMPQLVIPRISPMLIKLMIAIIPTAASVINAINTMFHKPFVIPRPPCFDNYILHPGYNRRTVRLALRREAKGVFAHNRSAWR